MSVTTDSTAPAVEFPTFTAMVKEDEVKIVSLLATLVTRMFADDNFIYMSVLITTEGYELTVHLDDKARLQAMIERWRRT